MAVLLRVSVAGMMNAEDATASPPQHLLQLSAGARCRVDPGQDRSASPGGACLLTYINNSLPVRAIIF
jgi:hypothetical protein